ncbi:MAG: hypothetical protein NTX03_10475 [Bacteroidetes bacterium]|nr:hypothetical protein [Bacteroidota bacterium]
MNTTEEKFNEIATQLPDAKVSKMFGATCIKVPNGKAAFMIYGDDIVFKLTGEELKEALALDGAHLFDPMGNRPMGGWVHLPPIYVDRWYEFAQKSMAYVKAIVK